MIYGERVRQLREMRQTTQSELAHALSCVSQYQLSRIETNFAQPSEEVEAMLAAWSGVTIDYLRRPPGPGITAHSPQLRSRSRLTQRAKYAAMQWASLVHEEYKELLMAANHIEPKLVRFNGISPIEAAHEVRDLLGFTQLEPLPYLILAVERIGVTVLGIPFTSESLDAFCAWGGEEPIIAVLDGVPGDRARFTVAHELGHLVLHREGQAGAAVEAEADEFAAELLTPRAALESAFPRHATLNSLAMLKTQWGVSVKSLIHSARSLGLIDPERATSFYKQISARGWNRAEPGYVPKEKPRAFRKLAEIKYGEVFDISTMARHAGWSEELAMQVMTQFAKSDELPHAPVRSVSSAGSNVIHLRRRVASSGVHGHHPGSPTNQIS